MKGFNINKYRLFFYFLGMLFLSFGLTMNSKVNLGVGSITTIAFALSCLYPVSFADMTLVQYVIFILIEMIIHFIKKKRKSYYLLDLVQLPFSLVFTRLMALYSGLIPVFAVDCAGTVFGTIPFRLLMLAVAICSTGIGAIMMLDMALIPNPGDGIVQAIASVVQKDIPHTKVWFDFGCVVVTVIICLIHGKGIFGINIGTLLSMFCVGRVMGLFNKVALKKLNELTQA